MESLATKLGRLPDPRHRMGQTYPFVPLLVHAALAVLGGARSLEGLSRFGRLRGVPFAHAVGYRSGRLPCAGAFRLLLLGLDAAAFERILAEFVRERLAARGVAAGPLALDGKALRGSRDGELPGVHLLALYGTAAGAALAQTRVDSKTNEHKAALDLLGLVDLEGAVVTGDAAFCQRDLSAAVAQKKRTTSGRSRTTSRP